MQIFEHVVVELPADGDPDATIYQIASITEGKLIAVQSDLACQPRGLRSAAVKAGIKYPDTYDTCLVAMDKPGVGAGIFTKNRSASPAVHIDRTHLADGQAQALIVLSKNANAFTPTDRADAMRICDIVAGGVGATTQDVLISCTGVIGVQLPMPVVEAGVEKAVASLQPGLIPETAQAILTTDKRPKVCSLCFSGVNVAAMAKGAGMTEPNMATMLVYFFTDLAIDADLLREMLVRVGDRTFNSISVDTDTSTSDSLIVLSTALVPATPDLLRDFEAALGAMMLKLSRDIVYQAEGATKVIEAQVTGALSVENARQVAKLIVNSPLVKTAVFGSDPNWGRVAMALGKPGQQQTGPIDTRCVVIRMNGATLFSRGEAVPLRLQELSANLHASKKIDIAVDLGEGSENWTAWGCDLSYDYVKTNAEYTS
ncbi:MULTISPECIES: bifunctional glutamate N-acetyltransferase/amino-acid acetyltransferase ArgJ [unclassified Delftia]|uniref:bifunctional glutamate N-acetyltransferase/amino-acid acetyltransferase ArgJ n=1 Tax=unclassified Delftia TaxID=2613839 RepID=UPI001900884A|nr:MULTISPECIES: bifunctional glutamate N-acetyltransferase/amino-acid acetyltransferase ArgJ [unclassified Delftia]MBK0113653.1 bifunctional glutamate N-acetyltransferase/amino-acid acetyltransferase ArgJ [Delftia sp. S65]MBK0118662.1 bifunctional glutamate N-acetyltransferase/amino-acid acetyltransferase ArgJ [Delftia sp. S67]MBK0132630.1 bifunctional glutamate N-acetyltransferase/amino-acid acetyltransferase ArgJ [Delftia sp. S66]